MRRTDGRTAEDLLVDTPTPRSKCQSTDAAPAAGRLVALMTRNYFSDMEIYIYFFITGKVSMALAQSTL